MKKKWLFVVAGMAMTVFMLFSVLQANSRQLEEFDSNCQAVWSATYATCSNPPPQGPYLDCINEAMCVYVSDLATCDCLFGNDPVAAQNCTTGAAATRAAAFRACRNWW